MQTRASPKGQKITVHAVYFVYINSRNANSSTVTERSLVIWVLEYGQEERIIRGQEGILWMIDMFIISVVVIVSWVHVYYVKTSNRIL